MWVKGKQIGNTGGLKNQAMVLVKYDNSTGKEVFELSKLIKKQFLINLLLPKKQKWILFGSLHIPFWKDCIYFNVSTS